MISSIVIVKFCRCLNPGVSYEVRKQKRADEIQALKEASKILDIEMI